MTGSPTNTPGCVGSTYAWVLETAPRSSFSTAPTPFTASAPSRFSQSISTGPHCLDSRHNHNHYRRRRRANEGEDLSHCKRQPLAHKSLHDAHAVTTLLQVFPTRRSGRFGRSDVSCPAIGNPLALQLRTTRAIAPSAAAFHAASVSSITRRPQSAGDPIASPSTM